MSKVKKNPSKKKNRGLIIVISVLSVAVLGLVLWQVVASQLSNNQPEKLTGYVVKSQEPLLLDGTVVSTQESVYTYNVEKGEITTIHVTTGQEVVAGQALYEYHNKTLANELEDMKRQQTRLYNQREASRKQLQEQKDKRWNYIVNVRDQSGDQTAEVDTQAFDSTIQSLETTINEQTASIEDLEAKIGRAQQDANQLIVAEHDGVVTVDLAGQKNATIPFMRVTKNASVIQTQISEYEYHLVAKDAPVTVYINAQDREINGTISSVASEPNSNNTSLATSSNNLSSSTNQLTKTAAYYAVKVSPLDTVQTGFTVQVRVPQKSVIVPEDAVVTIDGKEYVYVYQNGHAQKRAITRMKQGFQRVVVDGLAVDEVVIVAPNESVVDNAAVDVEIPQKEESSAP